jgi:hypothetical protein
MKLSEMMGVLRHVDMKKKRILAIVLANSLLHLHRSPWLDGSWGLDSLSFVYHTEGNNLRFDLSRAYLSTKFGASPRVDQSGRPSRELPSLLSLGRVLLEIELAESLDEIYRGSKFECYLNRFDPAINEAIIKCLLGELEKPKCHRYTNSPYIQSVRRCLNPNISQNLQKSGDPYSQPMVMKAIYVSIIAPLEQDLLGGFINKEEEPIWEDLEPLLSERKVDVICNWKGPAIPSQTAPTHLEGLMDDSGLEATAEEKVESLTDKDESPESFGYEIPTISLISS